MRLAARVDRNQLVIVQALRKMGCSVAITSALGHGFPDLVVGFSGKTFLMELKDGSKPLSRQKLTLQEENFFKTWKGHMTIIRSVDEAVNFVNNIRADL